jgi:peptidoglycan/LPS O-acetylase OafA/YrhL
VRRRDIEGLRAVAIAAVVAYHARPSALSGGFVGVDVFFVVSGFVITRVLWRELDECGRISARRFYAARARRLLPASALVIVATVVASALVLSPLAVRSVAKDAVTAAFYVANYRFAAEASNYLTAGGSLSPLQHYWSLGVEEQFYVLWPLLLFGASLAWRSGRRPSRLVAGAVIAVVAVASFALCWHLTAVDEPWAFYALPTRAFELATGALLALAEPRLGRLPPEVSAAAGWAGLVLVAAAATRFGPGTAFPGSAVIAPVLGTAGVIGAGCAGPRLGAGILLERRPMQWLGAISYSLYLWHFPVLVLAPEVIGRPLDLTATCVGVGLAVALAVITTVLVERPVRFSARLSPRWGLSLLTGGALSCAAAASAVLVSTSLPTLARTGPTHLASLAAPVGPAGVATNGRRAAGSSRRRATDGRLPSPALRADEALAASIAARVQATVEASAHATAVPADIDPPLAEASADEPPPFYDGCFDGFTDTTVHACEYADTAARRSIVLFGDSHALMWFPAIDAIADQHHLELVALAKATCPPLDLEVFSPDLDEWYWQCNSWRKAALARIDALHPALVVLGFSREYGVGNDHVLVYGPTWMRGLAEMIHSLRATGARVVVIGPVPYPPFLVPDCLAQYLDDPTQCSMPDESPWYDSAGVAAEESVVRRAGASYIDVQHWFCTAQRCLTMIGGIVAYRDDNHVSATYARWLTPAFAAELAVVTGGSL